MKTIYNYLKRCTFYIALAVTAGAFLFSTSGYADEPIGTALVDDFNDDDWSANVLGLFTMSGDPPENAGDLVSSYDVQGDNPYNPLNTSHQLSWDDSLGATDGPDAAWWFSRVSYNILPLENFTHVMLKLQGTPEPDEPEYTRNVVFLELQVQMDGYYRKYRAYEPVVEAHELDLTVVRFSDFHDIHDNDTTFADDLEYNLVNLWGVALVMTDEYMANMFGVDGYGTLFIEDVAFWSENDATIDELLIDDFEDSNSDENLLGLPTGGFGLSTEIDIDVWGSRRHSMRWDGMGDYWRTEVGNLDATGYTHLALDVRTNQVDMADLYKVTLVTAGPSPQSYTVYKEAGSDRIHEEYIPLNQFRNYGTNPPQEITDAALQNLQEIRLEFAPLIPYELGYVVPDLTNDLSGSVAIDDIRFVTLHVDDEDPTITNVQPADGKVTGNRRLPFSADVSDNRLNGVLLTLDEGREVPDEPTWVISGPLSGEADTINFTPAENLSFGWHVYQLIIWDAAGNTTTETRTFRVTRKTGLIPVRPRIP